METMTARSLVTLFFCLLGLAGWQSARAVDEDLYGEPSEFKFKEGPGWQEQAIELPGYPDNDGLIEVDLALNDFPFTLLIDPASLSVGEDRIVRYVGILRAESGVENVVYEGMRCTTRQYRRYAYGSGGRFYPVANSEWRYTGPGGQDRYRTTLMENFFCPLPSVNQAHQILEKLKKANPKRYLYSD